MSRYHNYLNVIITFVTEKRETLHAYLYVSISQLDKVQVNLLYHVVAIICTFFIITGDDLTVNSEDICHLIAL